MKLMPVGTGRRSAHHDAEPRVAGQPRDSHRTTNGVVSKACQLTTLMLIVVGSGLGLTRSAHHDAEPRVAGQPRDSHSTTNGVVSKACQLTTPMLIVVGGLS